MMTKMDVDIVVKELEEADKRRNGLLADLKNMEEEKERLSSSIRALASLAMAEARKFESLAMFLEEVKAEEQAKEKAETEVSYEAKPAHREVPTNRTLRHNDR